MTLYRRLAVLTALLALLITAAGGALAQEDTTEEEAPPPESVLVWTSAGAAGPGQQSAQQPGQVALIDADGNLTPLLDLPQGIATVMPCGETALSADGQYFAFYVGSDEGTLYMMDGTQVPVAIDTVERTTCLGGGTFSFSPSGNRFAYIAYPSGAAGSQFAAGFLKVVDAAGNTPLYDSESVTAFDISDDTVALVNFFTNDQGNADEAAVQVWDGENDREVATLRPDSNDTDGDCKFVSASVNILPSGELSLIMGQRCDRTGVSSWQLYTVNPADRSATRAATEPIVGSFQAYARTNVQFSAPDGASFVFTVPDGITAGTAGLFTTSLDTLTPLQIIDRQIVMPGFTAPANATPILSPDGRWLAVTQTSPNFDNTLLIYDLADLSLSPISFSAGSAGDTVSEMAFTRDSARVLAVIGGDQTANNSLVAFNLESGSDFRVERGRFNNRMAVNADGSMVAIGDWQVLEDPNEPPYLNLLLIDVNTSAVTTLFEGGDVQDGEVVEQSFAAPLAFRR